MDAEEAANEDDEYSGEEEKEEEEGATGVPEPNASASEPVDLATLTKTVSPAKLIAQPAAEEAANEEAAVVKEAAEKEEVTEKVVQRGKWEELPTEPVDLATLEVGWMVQGTKPNGDPIIGNVTKIKGGKFAIDTYSKNQARWTAEGWRVIAKTAAAKAKLIAQTAPPELRAMVERLYRQEEEAKEEAAVVEEEEKEEVMVPKQNASTKTVAAASSADQAVNLPAAPPSAWVEELPMDKQVTTFVKNAVYRSLDGNGENAKYYYAVQNKKLAAVSSKDGKATQSTRGQVGTPTDQENGLTYSRTDAFENRAAMEKFYWTQVTPAASAAASAEASRSAAEGKPTAEEKPAQSAEPEPVFKKTDGVQKTAIGETFLAKSTKGGRKGYVQRWRVVQTMNGSKAQKPVAVGDPYLYS